MSVNSTKFVERGFIRLGSEVVNGNVRLYIEDSGPGLPEEKKKALFASHQESLDLMHQGTGIGLSICRYLSRLMNAKIWLDEDYHSGIEGCPGARFIVDLQKAPVQDFEKFMLMDDDNRSNDGSCPLINVSAGEICKAQDQALEEELEQAPVLPENMNILFVDDEAILRKLFIRSVNRAAPTWTIQEAGNADAAIQILEKNPKQFDIIFIDQYMPSIERPLLGTEAVQHLRAMGIDCQICGLSANDLRHDFKAAGANGFLIKPFPCAKDILTRELARLLRLDDDSKRQRLPQLEDDESLHSIVDV